MEFVMPIATTFPEQRSIRSLFLLSLSITGISATSPLALDEVLWERNTSWASSSLTYASGFDCDVGSARACPREMGWQGREVRWTFELDADGAGVDELRFELVVTHVVTPVNVTISAGPSGAFPAEVGTWRIDSPRVWRLEIPASHFRAGARNVVRMRGDNRVGTGNPSGVVWHAAGLYRHYPAPPVVSDAELLDDTQWRACRYFWEQSSPNGLVYDTAGSEVASIAAVGFGATVMTILAERFDSATAERWTISPADARARASRMLDTILAIQSRQISSEATWGKAGIPYHFVDASGRRARGSEVSTVDAALLIVGLLQAGQYFGGELAQKADRVLDAIDFQFFYRPERRRYSHGWRPETGLIQVDWDRPGDETLLVCLLALAQQPEDAQRLEACYGYPRVTESYRGIPVVRSFFGSLFTYTFAHFWLPFECLGSDRPSAAGFGTLAPVDWWENSRRAVEANRAYHRARLASYPALGAPSFGASACYRADRADYFGDNGAEPGETLVRFDGTMPPYGAIMSLFLARDAEDDRAYGGKLDGNVAFDALRHYYDMRFATLWCSYGPRSSFDHRGGVSVFVTGVEKGPEALGIESWRTGRPARDLFAHPRIRRMAELVFDFDGVVPCPGEAASFVRGHINDDAVIDISDPVFLLESLFRGGASPECEDAADANDDGVVDLSDAINLFSFLFLGTPPPPAPWPDPGVDPTEDSLDDCV